MSKLLVKAAGFESLQYLPTYIRVSTWILSQCCRALLSIVMIGQVLKSRRNELGTPPKLELRWVVAHLSQQSFTALLRLPVRSRPAKLAPWSEIALIWSTPSELRSSATVISVPYVLAIMLCRLM